MGTPAVGDIGTKIVLTVLDEADAPVDVNAAVALTVKLRPMGGQTKSLTGLVNTIGTDGKVKAFSIAATWDRVGVWEAQVFADMGTDEFSSDPVTFNVVEKF